MKDFAKALQESCGQWVRLVNLADIDVVSDNVCIHMHGKLDYTQDDQTFCVMCQDDRGHGTNSISFKLNHVDDVFRQPSGILEITLL